MSKTVYLIGIGPGDLTLLTAEARNSIQASGGAVGAGRLLASLGDMLSGKETAELVKALDIVGWIGECGQETIAVVLSGDIGFFSGAKKLISPLEEMGCRVVPVSGMSSLVYLCGKLKRTWQDAKLVSLHGRKASILGPVLENEKTFFLTGPGMSVQDICASLRDKGMGSLKAHGGENLSYPEERIITGTVEELSEMPFDSLSVLLVENPCPLSRSLGNYGIPDSAFQRGDVPMTKEEVRAVSVSKLRVMKESIVYDVGAGTGSVAVEMACRATDGTVYAVEKNRDALELIELNKDHFGLKNIEVVNGDAPEALLPLPAPDRVFIGGSSGNMEEILRIVLTKNPEVRIVVNAVTLETLSETVRLFEEMGLEDVDVASVSVAKARKVGSYHLMNGLNPVFVISGQGQDQNQNRSQNLTQGQDQNQNQSQSQSQRRVQAQNQNKRG